MISEPTFIIAFIVFPVAASLLASRFWLSYWRRATVLWARLALLILSLIVGAVVALEFVFGVLAELYLHV